MHTNKMQEFVVLRVHVTSSKCRTNYVLHYQKIKLSIEQGLPNFHNVEGEFSVKVYLKATTSFLCISLQLVFYKNYLGNHKYCSSFYKLFTKLNDFFL